MNLAPKIWSKISKEQQNFLANLGTKLEPIIQILPAIPGVVPPIVGFECLALGPQGQSFPQIFKSVPENVDPVFIKFLLAFASIKTAQVLRSDVAAKGVKGLDHLLFTINLEPDMAESPYFHRFMEGHHTGNFYWELNEDTKDTKFFKELKEIFGFKYFLDDLNDWGDKKAANGLKKQATGSKIDYRCFQKLMEDLGDNPQAILRGIKGYRIPKKPLIVEGLAEEKYITFLQNRGDKNSAEPLFGQGHGVTPNGPWQDWLTDRAYLFDF